MGTVMITPEKGIRPRLKKLKPETVAALLRLPKVGRFIFHREKANPYESYDDFYRYYAMQRTKIRIQDCCCLQVVLLSLGIGMVFG